MCGDEPAFTQGFAEGLLARCFFRKPTSPPLNLKGSSKTHQSSLSLKEGSTAFPKPLFLMEKVGCTRQYESELSLRSFAQPFPSGDKGCTNRPFNSLYDPFGSPYRGQKRCSNRFAIWMADHQRSTPAAKLRFFVRDEPQGHTMLDACSMLMEPQGHTNRCLMLIARNLLRLLLMGTQGHE